MSNQISVNTSEKIIPMIYSYSTPENISLNGWTKIGYTERQTVEERIHQQTHTAGITPKLEWKGNALFDDGSGDSFTDHELHAYLKKLEIERKPNTEWFHIDGSTGKGYYRDFKENRGILTALDTTIPYQLRKEQDDAVTQTMAYSEANVNSEFLWNAKPRFGKTLSVYDFCIRKRAQNVLIVTNRPAIANSWYSDYVQFVGAESGYIFLSEVDSIKDEKYVMTREKYLKYVGAHSATEDIKCIAFVSLQDLKGSVYFGGQYDKLRYVKDTNWDILVIDEAHEGVDTYKTDTAFRQINRKFTLHLSGTPFKALANDKFNSDAIYNWTYADEQEAKTNWVDSNEIENPYGALPTLNMFTYQMSEIIKDEVSNGIEIDGETKEYAFDLNEFFETNGQGSFVHNYSVDRFLDAMTTQEKYPFSTNELRDELKHTLWLLNRVDSARALAKKLSNHPVFNDYEVVLAAGDGKIDDDDANLDSYNKVVEAIKTHDKTITLSVGQLTTGITIPEWTAVIMLSNVKSPALYMQAAFRAQNPYKFRKGTEVYRKMNAYVFDFDPARTLIIYDAFANDIYPDGAKDTEQRKENIKRLLNFFPVLGEDEEGKMVLLDAEKVLSIPRKIKSEEVVKRGFMSNFLFQNIGNIFNAPKEFVDIINQFEPVSEPKAKSKSGLEVPSDITDNAYVDEQGNVSLNENFVIGQTQNIFGDKIYGELGDEITNAVDTIDVSSKKKEDEQVDTLYQLLANKAVKPIIMKAQTQYGEDLSNRQTKRIENVINHLTQSAIRESIGDYKVKTNTIEAERQDALNNSNASEARAVNAEFDKKQEDAIKELKDALSVKVDDIVKQSKKTVVETVEKSIKEKQINSVEDTVRDHLRGFSRTIPSFLMAYGDESVTLYTFDENIPDAVFKEVTSVTLDQFRLLRDGYDYTDIVTGEVKHHAGFFDQVVFDDSVREFLRLRKALADYFDEAAKEDIFDYIPPQRTNQIFTPKKTVKQMVDMLEEENPGCFETPDKTFIDLYMKSGLYITEIVKRLYNSDCLKAKFPDGEERLKHIFEKQVYGLAPTEIIYKIATNYILGFDENTYIEKHNFRQVDVLPYAKDGTLDAKLDEIFGSNPE